MVHGQSNHLERPDLPALVRPGEQVLFRTVGNEGVLLNMDTGRYFGLDEVGARVWQLLVAHRDVATVCTLLVEEFDVDDGELQADLGELLDQLIAHRLLYVDA